MNRRVTSSGTVCSALAVLAVCSSALATTSGQITATIYVEKHFEVRDHDQPTKYVFNGATRVASITGLLSANTRIQRLRLYPGWNLCSLAVSAGNALQQFNSLSASGGEGQGKVVLSAFKWKLPTQGWLPVATNDNLAAGTVLWLKARTNAVIAVLGTYSDPTQRHVSAGETYLSGCGLESWSLDQSFSSPASLWFYAADFRQWFARLTGDLTFISQPLHTVAPGQAIYLKVDVPVDVRIPDPTVRIRYYHQDHLGSSSVMTDSEGALVEETAFYPFGEPRNKSQPREPGEPYGFTQKEQDRESRLHYFEARFLASHLSRFLKPDRKYSEPDMLSAEDLPSFLENPQQINSYAYVRNNPIDYTDPTGLTPFGSLHDPGADQPNFFGINLTQTPQGDSNLGRTIRTASEIAEEAFGVLSQVSHSAATIWRVGNTNPRFYRLKERIIDLKILAVVEAAVIKGLKERLGKQKEVLTDAKIAIGLQSFVIKQQQKEINRLKAENEALKRAPKESSHPVTPAHTEKPSPSQGEGGGSWIFGPILGPSLYPHSFDRHGIYP